MLLRNGQGRAEPKADRRHELGRVGPLETSVEVWTVFLTRSKMKMDHHQGWLSSGVSESRPWLRSSLGDAFGEWCIINSARLRVKS